MRKFHAHMVLAACVVPAVLLLCVGCATAPGEITVSFSAPKTVYISPANDDGIQDSFAVPLSVLTTTNIALQAYEFTATDKDGAVVRTISDRVAEAKRGIARFFEKPQSVPIPDVLVWDGRDDSGRLVPDGAYTCTAAAWDQDGNKGVAPSVQVIVDNTPPSVDVYVAYPVFSPNGDGLLDTITIRQAGSTREDSWNGIILDSRGVETRSFHWEGTTPDLVWDGTDESGRQLVSGTFSYRVESIDRAGNIGSGKVAEIVIDTAPSSVSLSAVFPSFSPNDDGKKDTQLFSVTAQRKDGIRNWSLAIYSESGKVVRTIGGSDVLEPMVPFDGRDDAGVPLPDGRYLGVATVTYANGDRPRAASRPFLLDTTAPVARIALDRQVFSPDGDGHNDTLAIHQSTSSEGSWVGAVASATGLVVKTANWSGEAGDFIWDGIDDDGRPVEDGLYVYTIAATDAADNSLALPSEPFRVDTRPTPVSLSTVTDSLSPNDDGLADTITIVPGVMIEEGVQLWRLSVVNSEGDVVRSLGGSLVPLPRQVSWNGRDEGGTVVEGAYHATLRVEYVKGNVATARTKGDFIVDVTPPAVVLRADPRAFSPDGDGLNDTATFALSATDKSPVTGWVVQVLDPYGHEFMSFGGSTLPTSPISWDGRSRSGEVIQAATEYRVVARAVDKVWNTGTASAQLSVDVFTMSSGERLIIRISSIIFQPNTADYLSLPDAQVEKNLKTLDRVAEILRKYPDYAIRLEGNGVRIFWDDPYRWKAEEDQVLIPLTVRRAEAVRDALVSRGIEADRITTAGNGGYNPVVPHGDLDNRWKNRRVEFVLSRK